MIWNVENPVRARDERAAIDALAGSVDWFVPGDWRIDSSLRLILDAEIRVADRVFPVSLRYPSHFPHSPPLVLPRESERWTSHQYGPGGELCLEWRPDNWHPSITGANMLESAYRLLSGERPAPGQTGRVLSAHNTTLGQQLRGDKIRLMITRNVAKVCKEIPAGEMREGELLASFHKAAVNNFIASITLEPGKEWVDDTIPETVSIEGLKRKAAIIRIPAEMKFPVAKSKSDIPAFVAALGLTLPKTEHVIFVKGDDFKGYLLDKDEDTFWVYALVPPEESATRIDAGHATMATKSVALIGCGSIGSKIAVTLARAGVGRFLLIDDDVLMPGNLVRNQLDWREMAGHKVDGVARSIQLVNPKAECDARQQRLGGQHASGTIESLIETVAKYDLIIDATADAHVFNYLCAAVAVGNKPLLWCEIFGGGVGGLIARHRPAQEPPPATMRAAIEQWFITQGKTPPVSLIDYETRADGPPLIADDADVSVIAAHASRLAVDTLIGRTPSMFPYSAYLIGLAASDYFDQPFETHPIDVGVAANENEPAADPELAAAEAVHLLTLYKKFSDEAAAAAAGNQTT